MEILATNIYEVIKDYRASSAFQMTTAHILDWAAQFDTDAEFMLQELNHFIKKTYLSKSSAQKHLLHQVNRLIQMYNRLDLSILFIKRMV
jgi:poly-gamma-glutamate capsule biosynthesis protein CapA/YwtB (metallophosphatase superfamily)